MIATLTQKQPKALPVLFFTEFWERFGFYAVQALLVLFLIGQRHYSDNEAYSLFGAYTALIYITPVVGGYLADRVMGYRGAIFFGGVILCLGYLGLTLHRESLFFGSLALLICGNGFFKSCISSLLGTYYEKDDPRRDSGFTLFYMGINSGTFLSTLICPIVATKYGYPYGFGLATIGMIIGLVIFLLGQRIIRQSALPTTAPTPKAGYKKTLGIYIGTLIALLPIVWLLEHHEAINWGLGVFALIILAYLFKVSRAHSKEQRLKLYTLLILMLFSIVFWSFYWQMFLSIMLFIERNVDRHLGHWEIPAATFTTLVAIFIIALSPVFAKMWFRLNKKGKDLSIPGKFILGLVFVSVNFLLLALAALLSQKTGLSSPIWVVIAYLFVTFGELSLSPIGLSAVTQLAPQEVTGMLMGVWFMTLAAAGPIGGKLATLADIPATMTDPVLTNAIYQHAFLIYGITGLVFALVLFLGKWALSSSRQKKRWQ